MGNVDRATVDKIGTELGRIGYRKSSVIRNYEFADLVGGNGRSRVVPLAAFTDTPPSYRTAAVGVLDQVQEPAEAILEHRDLGAPIWMCLTDSNVQSWLLRDETRPVPIAVHRISELPKLFRLYRLDWSPESVHRAKLVARDQPMGQLDLSGFGLLASIESRVCRTLDLLIRDALARMFTGGAGAGRQLHILMELAFVMIASKILVDRHHATAQRWNTSDFLSVFHGIRSYYSLDYLTLPSDRRSLRAVQEAWEAFRGSINLRNISAEDLAFVYENTLVTPETRKKFGTYSTPRVVAEYIVEQLRVEAYPLDKLKVYEPFCGAAVLLVAAAKKLRALMPPSWADAKRHEFLVKRLRGSDIEQFAKQVATLSLILADYPNQNGWDIRVHDLFRDDALQTATPQDGIVLCNPPFDDFTFDERNRYLEQNTRSVHKPVAVLKAVLEQHPLALGFVMPHGLIGDATYLELRRALAECYDEIELVSLPDKIFANSSVESSLLIARRDPQAKDRKIITLRSTTVPDVQRNRFLDFGTTPAPRTLRRERSEAEMGDLWLRELGAVWEYMRDYSRLGSIVRFHRGIEWVSGHQSSAFSNTPKPGYRSGFHTVDHALQQFCEPKRVYLDCRPQFLRGNAIDLPWDEPKVLFNAARLSRGNWRIAAWVDKDKRLASQQFIGCWRALPQGPSLLALCAMLNSPIASAFVKEYNERKGFRLAVLQALPVPGTWDAVAIEKRVQDYLALLEQYHGSIFQGQLQDQLEEALLAIDAGVLKAYDLPPRLERQLLDFFREQDRPTLGARKEFFPVDFKPFVSLEEFRQGWQKETSGDWFRRVFKPLPKDEAKLLGRWF